MGKGSSPRPIADPKGFRENYERAFPRLERSKPPERAEHIREIIDRIRSTITTQTQDPK
jgi:hypothetical protein